MDMMYFGYHDPTAHWLCPWCHSIV